MPLTHISYVSYVFIYFSISEEILDTSLSDVLNNVSVFINKSNELLFFFIKGLLYTYLEDQKTKQKKNTAKCDKIHFVY